MRKYQIVEEYIEKIVTTSTNSFDEMVLVYQDQMNGTTQPAERIKVYMECDGKYVLIVDKEL